MNFFDWEIDMDPALKPYVDLENRRMAMAIRIAEDDEIHMALEFDKNQHLVMHPRWNINIIIMQKNI